MILQEVGNLSEAEEARDRLYNGEGASFEQAKRFASKFDDQEELLIEAFTKLRSLMISAEFIGLFQESA